MAIHAKFALGAVTHGPGAFWFFGLNIFQQEDHSFSIDGDDKLKALETMLVSRIRRRQRDQRLIAVEQRTFE